MILKMYVAVEVLIDEDQVIAPGNPDEGITPEQLQATREDAKERIARALYDENGYKEALSVEYDFTHVTCFDTLQDLFSEHALPEAVGAET